MWKRILQSSRPKRLKPKLWRTVAGASNFHRPRPVSNPPGSSPNQVGKWPSHKMCSSARSGSARAKATWAGAISTARIAKLPRRIFRACATLPGRIPGTSPCLISVKMSAGRNVPRKVPNAFQPCPIFTARSCIVTSRCLLALSMSRGAARWARPGAFGRNLMPSTINS